MAKCQLSEENIALKQELEHHAHQVEILQEKLVSLKVSECNENDSKKELEFLWRRVRAASTLLTCLKSKARLMAVPSLSYTSCRIKHQEGTGLIDKHEIPLSDWSQDIDLISHGSSDEETPLANSASISSPDANDGVYIGEIFKSVHMVSDVMESLVKKVIMAETEAASEKQKVSLGQEEIARKTIQIENMSAKVIEMEKFASSTNGLLDEMRQRVEEMVEETFKQRQRAAENGEELCRVKHEFESLMSCVSRLISVRETLLLSKKQFQTMERLFNRLVAKSAHIESEKVQKEAEVQKLMEENVSLRALLDKKEAQLLAMNEECKFMALNNSGS